MNLVKKTFLPLAVIILVSSIALMACGGEEEAGFNNSSADNGAEPGFGIYLVDSGELVLSEYHIKAYRRGVQFYDDVDTHVIELNEEGIEKWNSYMTYESIPKLADSLYSRDFILKIEGEEIYGGKFYSMVSSMSYGGVVILDALVELDNDHNYIRIDYGYPTPGFATGEDPRNSPEVIDYLERRSLLE
ncbi:MAG TPA: hypothetical protein G4O18_04985 [Dehalococcoidia bacterium]|nr:hypothetical protein [Dehalococcoidia bacterium]